MFSLANALKLLDLIGPATAAMPSFKEIWDDVIATFNNSSDQATLQEAYEDLIADNDEGHNRLQAKLAEAAKR